MSLLSRRSFLGRAAVAGAGASGLAARPASAWNPVPLVREEQRAVVIGSGFGGGVSALRLAQAGVPVLVLERGRRWPTGPDADTFASATAVDKRVLWYGSDPQILGMPLLLEKYAGLIEAVIGENMTALCAAAVGGGSLLYQGMSLQPAEAVFNAHLPEALDFRRMAAEHYPRVARMLQLAEAPDALIDSPTYAASRIFARNVRAAGFPVSKVPMPIDWEFALRELRGEMKPSYTNGDGALGVNNGGKHSIDVTYLAQAEQTGLVSVATLHDVTRIRRARNGRWKVYVDHTDDTGKVLEQKIITTKALIMAAGSLNTTKLLVKAKAVGDIPGLPDAVGQGWGTNADRIYVWRAPEEDFGPAQGGPVVYGSLEWDDPATANTVIQAALPPIQPLTHQQTMLVGYGVSDARGRFEYDWLAGEAKLKWPKDGDAKIHARIRERVDAVAAGPQDLLIDANALLPNTWHALGGACMETVCDLEGRVHDQPGLYVLDGALIPGSTAACNPSMTIAAVAERALDDIVARDVGSVI